MSYVYPLNYESKGRYAEVKINRNLLYFNAPNENSRTLKVTIRNTDSVAHEYTVVLLTGTQYMQAGTLLYTTEKVKLNPGETRVVHLDIAKGSGTAPIADAKYTHPALHVFKENETTPDVVIYPIWVININDGWTTRIIFDKPVKYLIQGFTYYTEPRLGSTEIFHFFITDMDDEEYVLVIDNTGILIATSPFDGTGGAIELREFVNKDPNKDYKIILSPVTSGLIRIGVDLVVDYDKLGNWLGSAFAWLAAAYTDLIAVFLNNRFLRHLVLAQINPILAMYWGAQNITIDAYVDPNDKTKVHIVLYTYYNIYDDPLGPLAIALIAAGLIGGLALGFYAVHSWKVVELRKADVQELDIRTKKEMWDDYFAFMRDEKIPLEAKQMATTFATAVINSLSQSHGLVFCEGWAIGNSCISWKFFLGIAAVAGVLLFISMLKK